MKRFCFAFFISLMIFLTGCKSSNPKNISGISSSPVWENFGHEQINITMMSGLPGMLNSPKHPNTTYQQINSFLKQSGVYTKAVPKDNITHPFMEAAGYLGPPELTISDKQHKIVINPAWYIDTPQANNFAVHQVPNILEVNFDGKTSYVQSQSFYNWMYNKEWLSSFQNYTIPSQ